MMQSEKRRFVVEAFRDDDGPLKRGDPLARQSEHVVEVSRAEVQPVVCGWNGSPKSSSDGCPRTSAGTGSTIQMTMTE
jgi:hypothetical protein